jgi:hypothetical protein
MPKLGLSVCTQTNISVSARPRIFVFTDWSSARLERNSFEGSTRTASKEKSAVLNERV